MCLVAAGWLQRKCCQSISVNANIFGNRRRTDLEKGCKGINAKSSVGGIVECVVKGLPID